MESRKDWSSSTIEISDCLDNTASGALLAATEPRPRARLSTVVPPRIALYQRRSSKPWFRALTAACPNEYAEARLRTERRQPARRERLSVDLRSQARAVPNS